jgi:SprT protein
MNAEIQAIKNKVQECVKIAEAKFGIKMPYIEIRFDLRGRAAGMAGLVRRMSGDQFYLRFNVQHMRLGGQTWLHLLNETVPHEVAHTVCQAFPKFGRNHDAGWKRVCRALGGNGSTRYSENDAPEAVAQMRPWVYITTTGHQVRITKVIHNKIQQGQGYVMKNGLGKVNRDCQFNWMSAPAEQAAAKPIVINKPAPAINKSASKADQVRARIALAKKDGEGSSVVVNYAVTVLGMSLALAKTYVKNNWSKA